MKNVTTICDRCRGVIVEAGTALTVEAGGLRKRLGPQAWDLCSDCSELLTDWIAEGRPSEEAGNLEPTERRRATAGA